MKKFIISFFLLICTICYNPIVLATQPPYHVQTFYYSEALIEWIASGDLDEADSVNLFGNDSYKYRPFVQQLRNDNTLLIPKYNGAYFPVNNEGDRIGVVICPDVPYEQRYYGFFGEENNKISVRINRIEDQYISLAADNYEEYLRQHYPQAVRYDQSTEQYQATHMIIDKKYDVIIQVFSEGAIDEALKGISFDKIKLSDPKMILSSFAWNGSKTGTLWTNGSWSRSGYIWMALTAVLATAAIALYALFFRHKATKLN